LYGSSRCFLEDDDGDEDEDEDSDSDSDSEDIGNGRIYHCMQCADSLSVYSTILHSTVLYCTREYYDENCWLNGSILIAVIIMQLHVSAQIAYCCKYRIAFASSIWRRVLLS